MASGRARVVMLMDRGAMDGKVSRRPPPLPALTPPHTSSLLTPPPPPTPPQAYMSDAQWELMLEEMKLTRVMLRDQRCAACSPFRLLFASPRLTSPRLLSPSSPPRLTSSLAFG